MKIAPTTEVRGPETSARVLLVATMLASSYLDFFGYRAQGFAAAGAWADRIQGLAPAPEQYRVGIVWFAHNIATHLHIALTMALGSIDCVSGLIALLVLFQVLERTSVYRSASTTGRWLGAACFVLLVEWFLGWLLWLQKPETLPAAMLLALMLWLWQGEGQRTQSVPRVLILIGLSAILATFRADIACLLDSGILLCVLANRTPPLALSRGAATVTSLLGALIAGTVQLYLMIVVFPHASYGPVKLWQLRPNLVHASRWPPFALFLLPLIWMAVQVARRRFERDAAGIAFLAGAVLFSVLWITIGKIDEVRIFLPFALALVPLTAQMAMLHVEEQKL